MQAGENEEKPEEYKRITFNWGVVMLRTRRFTGLMDRLGAKRITGPASWLLLYLMPIAAGTAFFLFLGIIGLFFSSEGVTVVTSIRSITPLANIGLPGINPYIPWLYGWVALFVAMVVHEAAHGVVARSFGLPVKSAGLLFFLVLPIGAFVEVDDKELKAARARDSGRVLAAGAGINFVLAFFCLVLLILAVSTMVPLAKGAAIVSVVPDTPQQHSPADLAGIEPGDFVTALNGMPVTDLTVLENTSMFHPGQVVDVTLFRGGQTIDKNVTLGSVVVQNTSTDQNYTYAFLGVREETYASLVALVSIYSSANTMLTHGPLAYICAPTFPNCSSIVPFSDDLSIFYGSPLGPSLPVLANTLFWLWFLNFNLAIFNALPIYPFDGGQAFEVAVRAIGKGKITDLVAKRITTGVTLSVICMVLFVVVGPYLTLFF